MKTLTLTAENHVIDALLGVIHHFSKQDVVFLETKEEQPVQQSLSMHDLAGILAPYNHQGYLSDEQMQNAISEQLAEKAMLK